MTTEAENKYFDRKSAGIMPSDLAPHISAFANAEGVPAVSLSKYKLSNLFTGRSIYMQVHTGSFKEDFSKNTFYRFLNLTKNNGFRFSPLFAVNIVNNDIRSLTDYSRKNVFIIADTLFNRISCRKTELGWYLFDLMS